MNDHLEKLMFDELKNSCRPGAFGGFLPGVKQIANVAALPGIIGVSYFILYVACKMRLSDKSSSSNFAKTKHTL